MHLTIPLGALVLGYVITHYVFGYSILGSIVATVLVTYFFYERFPFAKTT